MNYKSKRLASAKVAKKLGAALSTAVLVAPSVAAVVPSVAYAAEDTFEVAGLKIAVDTSKVSQIHVVFRKVHTETWTRPDIDGTYTGGGSNLQYSDYTDSWKKAKTTNTDAPWVTWTRQSDGSFKTETNGITSLAAMNASDIEFIKVYAINEGWMENEVTIGDSTVGFRYFDSKDGHTWMYAALGVDGENINSTTGALKEGKALKNDTITFTMAENSPKGANNVFRILGATGSNLVADEKSASGLPTRSASPTWAKAPRTVKRCQTRKHTLGAIKKIWGSRRSGPISKRSS